MSPIYNNILRSFTLRQRRLFTTTKALQALSIEDKPICYWRVVKKKGELIANGVKWHAERLEKEVFETDSSKKNSVVVGYEARLGKLA